MPARMTSTMEKAAFPGNIPALDPMNGPYFLMPKGYSMVSRKIMSTNHFVSSASLAFLARVVGLNGFCKNAELIRSAGKLPDDARR